MESSDTEKGSKEQFYKSSKNENHAMGAFFAFCEDGKTAKSKIKIQYFFISDIFFDKIGGFLGEDV